MTAIISTHIVIVTVDGSVSTTGLVITGIGRTFIVIIARYIFVLASVNGATPVLGTSIVIVAINRCIDTSSIRIASVNGTSGIIITADARVFTTNFTVTEIFSTSIVVLTIDKTEVTDTIAPIVRTCIAIITDMIVIFTTVRRITAIIGTEVIIVTVYRRILATIGLIATIHVACVISLAVIRNISINTSKGGITVRFSTSIRSRANNIWSEDTTGRRITGVCGTSIIIVTDSNSVSDGSVWRIRIRITIINGTSITIISRSDIVLASNEANTFNRVTSIHSWAFVDGSGTTRRRIARVYGTRIVVITANGFMVTSSIRITVVIGTSVIIIARFSIGVATS